jgi:hypothetical protein
MPYDWESEYPNNTQVDNTTQPDQQSADTSAVELADPYERYNNDRDNAYDRYTRGEMDYNTFLDNTADRYGSYLKEIGREDYGNAWREQFDAFKTTGDRDKFVENEHGLFAKDYDTRIKEQSADPMNDKRENYWTAQTIARVASESDRVPIEQLSPWLQNGGKDTIDALYEGLKQMNYGKGMDAWVVPAEFEQIIKEKLPVSPDPGEFTPTDIEISAKQQKAWSDVGLANTPEPMDIRSKYPSVSEPLNYLGYASAKAADIISGKSSIFNNIPPEKYKDLPLFNKFTLTFQSTGGYAMAIPGVGAVAKAAIGAATGNPIALGEAATMGALTGAGIGSQIILNFADKIPEPYRQPLVNGATNYIKIVNYLADKFERAIGTLSVSGNIVKEVAEAKPNSLESALYSLNKCLDTYWTVSGLSYELAGMQLGSKQGTMQTWKATEPQPIETIQLPEGVGEPGRQVGRATLGEGQSPINYVMQQIAQEIEANPDKKDEIIEKWREKTGMYGAWGELIGNVVLDPLNYLPEATAKGLSEVAKSKGNKQLAIALEQGQGRPIQTMQAYKSEIKFTKSVDTLSGLDKFLLGATKDAEGKISFTEAGKFNIKEPRTWIDAISTPQAKALRTVTSTSDILAAYAAGNDTPEGFYKWAKSLTEETDLSKMTPAEYTAKRILEDQNVMDKLSNQMNTSWQAPTPDRIFINNAALLLGEKPEDLLVRLAPREKEPYTLRATLGEIQKAAGSAPTELQAVARTVTDYLPNIDDKWETKVAGRFRDGIFTLNAEEMKLKMAASLGKAVETKMLQRYNIKESNALYRSLYLAKTAQSLVLLKLNPSYYINNWMTNRMHMIWDGVFRVGKSRQEKYWASMGFEPTRMGQAANPTMEFGANVKPTVGRVGAVTEGYRPGTVIAEAMRKGDFLDKSRDFLNKFPNLFEKMERADAREIWTAFSMNAMRDNWRAGRGFTEIGGPELDRLVEMGMPREAVREINGRLASTINRDELSHVLTDETTPTHHAEMAFHALDEMDRMALDPHDFREKLKVELDAGVPIDKAVDNVFKNTNDQVYREWLDKKLSDVTTKMTDIIGTDGKGDFSQVLMQWHDSTMKDFEYNAANFQRYEQIYKATEGMRPADARAYKKEAFKQIEMDYRSHNLERATQVMATIRAMEGAGGSPEITRQVETELMANHGRWSDYYQKRADLMEKYYMARDGNSPIHEQLRNEIIGALGENALQVIDVSHGITRSENGKISVPKGAEDKYYGDLYALKDDVLQKLWVDNVNEEIGSDEVIYGVFADLFKDQFGSKDIADLWLESVKNERLQRMYAMDYQRNGIQSETLQSLDPTLKTTIDNINNGVGVRSMGTDERMASWPRFVNEVYGLLLQREGELRATFTNKGNYKDLTAQAQTLHALPPELNVPGSSARILRDAGIPTATIDGRSNNYPLRMVNKYLGTDYKSLNEIPPQDALKAIKLRAEAKTIAKETKAIEKLSKQIAKDYSFLTADKYTARIISELMNKPIEDVQKALGKLGFEAVGTRPPETKGNLGDMPFVDAQMEHWRERVPLAIDHFKEQLKQSYNKGGLLDYIQDPAYKVEAKRILDGYTAKVQNELSQTKLAASKWGENRRDFALLNYSDRTWLDEMALPLAPYQFWYTRTAINWMQRFIDRPTILMNMLRLKAFQQNIASQNEGYPSRLKDKFVIPLPFSGKIGWMGSGIYYDPMRQSFPFLQLMRMAEKDFAQNSVIDKRVESVLMDMVDNGDVSTDQAKLAISSKDGNLYKQVLAQAEEELGQNRANGYDIVKDTLMSPMLPLQWAMTGKITQTPPEKLFKNITGSMGMNKGAGYSVAQDQYAANVPDKILAYMVGTGDITATQAKQAMLEKAGSAWEEAQKRSSQYGLFKQLGAPLQLDILPTGEKIQRDVRDMYYAALEQKDQGNPKPLEKFYDEHPEMNVMQMAYKDNPEERLRYYLRGEIWDRINALSDPEKKGAYEKLGSKFMDNFLNKETRDYDSISTETMGAWTQMLNGYVPPDKRQAILDPIKFMPEEAKKKYEAYKSERTLRFGTGANELQNIYYALPEEQRNAFAENNPALAQMELQKNQFMLQNPDIRSYMIGKENKLYGLDEKTQNSVLQYRVDLEEKFPKYSKDAQKWKDQYMAAHPEIIPYVLGEKNELKGAPPEIQRFVIGYRAQKAQMFPDNDVIWDEYNKLKSSDPVGAKAYWLDHPELENEMKFQNNVAYSNPAAMQYIFSDEKIKSMMVKNDPALKETVKNYEIGKVMGNVSEELMKQLNEFIYLGKKPSGSAMKELSRIMKENGYKGTVEQYMAEMKKSKGW